MKKKLAKALALFLTVPLGLGLASASTLSDAEAADAEKYVLMNIPYGSFYAGEAESDVAVDTVSSATKNKTRAYDLAKGSYHSQDGSAIYGITYPVKVPAGFDLSKYARVDDTDTLSITLTLRGNTTTTALTGSAVLFEKPDYSYYELKETPSYYKELNVNADGSLSFGKSSGTHQTVSGVKSELLTETHWGEYELNILDDEFINSIDTVYGVTLNTTDGRGYGMRDIQNLWRKNEIAWNSLKDSDPDGGHDSSYRPYASLMGKTISTVTYYTDKGIYDLDIEDTYVPVKTAETTATDAITAAEAEAGAGSTTITAKNLPADSDYVYSVVTGTDPTAQLAKGFAPNGTTISYSGVLPGTYILKGTDTNHKYASIYGSFTLTGDIPVALSAIRKGLTAVNGASTAEVANYIRNISSVTVDGKEYSTGRRGVTIVKEDGSIDLTQEPFKTVKDSYSITIKSAGYPDLTASDVPLETRETPVVSRTSIKKAKVTGVKKTVKYTGKKITQKKLRVTLNGKKLVKGTDYTVSYKNNKKKGTATITIKGKGDYKGSKKVTFKIR